MDLPMKIIPVLRQFEEVFSERVWEWAKVLLIGAILAPGERTVAAILRVMELQHERQFQNYHRVLNRAHWSSRALSRLLLHLLVRIFVPGEAPIVVGIDETIGRRRGAKIAAKGIYRDPVRSSKDFFVKTSGLRWVSMMLLTPIPWVQRVWALPFLTVLAPSERYNEQHRRRHKKITDCGRQMIRQLRRLLPDRYLVVVADGSYAVLELLACAAGLREPVTVITRLRLDAALYDPAPARKAGTNGRPRLKGERQPTLAQRLVDPKTNWEKLTSS
jgi:DDE superfamily endonuclease